MADENIYVDIKVDMSELEKAQQTSKKIENKFKDGIKIKFVTEDSELNQSEDQIDKMDGQKVNVYVKVHDDGSLKNANDQLGKMPGHAISAKNALSKLSGGLKSVGSMLNIAAAGLQNVGNNMEMIGRLGLIGGTIAGGGIVAGLGKLVTAGVESANSMEDVQAQLKAQGVQGKALKNTFAEVRSYAEKSAFGMTDLGDGISAVNSQVGDIEKSTKVAEEFGTALMAAGKSSDGLKDVAFNLGQLGTGTFSKADFKELIKGVPSMAQALAKLQGGDSSWEAFNKALGDDPSTKEIERTGNALDYVLEAITKYNKETNALEESQNRLSAVFDNMKEKVSNTLGDIAKSSGLTGANGKLAKSLNNLFKGFEKNTPLIEKFYSKLGDLAVDVSKKIADFDYQAFFSGLKDGFNDFKASLKEVKDYIDSVFNENPEMGQFFDKVKNYFTGGETGAKGLGKGLVKGLQSSIGLVGGGVAVKGLSSVISMLSVGISLAGELAGGLSKITPSGLSFGGGGSKSPDVTESGLLDKIKKQLGKIKKQKIKVDPNEFVPTIDYTKTKDPGKIKQFASTLATTLSTNVDAAKLKMDKPITKTKQFFSGISKGLGGAVKAGGRAVKTGAGKLASGLKSVAGGLVGIGTDILAITTAVQMFDNLPDANVIGEGFIKIGAVMIGMNTINTVSGAVNKLLGVDAVAGALGNLVNAGSIVALSMAVKQLKDLPDQNEIQSAMGKLTMFMLETTALTTIKGVGALASGGLTAIAEGIGAFTTALSAGSILALTQAVKSLSDLPSDGEIETGMSRLTSIMNKMEELNDAIETGFWQSLGDKLSTDNMSGTVNNLVEMGTGLSELTNVSIPDPTTIDNLVKSIRAVVDGLGDGNFLDELGALFTNLGEKWKTDVQGGTMENFTQMVGELQKVASIPPVPEGQIDALITSIKTVVGKMKELTSEGGILNEAENYKGMGNLVSQIDGVVGDLASITTSLSTIQGKALNAKTLAEQTNIAIDGMKSALDQLRSALSGITDSATGQTIGEDVTSDVISGGGNSASGKRNLSTGEMTGIDMVLEQINGIVTKLATLGETLVDIQEAKANADQIKTAMEQLMASLSQILESMRSDAMDDVMQGIDSSAVQDAINGINEFVQSVQNAIKGVANIQPEANVQGVNLGNKVVEGFRQGIKNGNMQQSVSQALNNMQQIGQTAGEALKNGFTSGVSGMADAAIKEVDAIQQALNGLTVPTLDLQITSNVSELASQISSLQSAANNFKLPTLPTAGLSRGGEVAYRAKGGAIGKIFSSIFKPRGTDTVPAMLTEGEYVQSRPAVNFWGKGMMEAINSRNVGRVSELMQRQIGRANQTYNYNTYNTTNNPTVNQTFNGGNSQDYNHLASLIRGM